MYLKTFGACLGLSIITSFVAQVGFDLFANIWLSLWSADMNNVGPNSTVDTELAEMRVGVYGGIGGAQSKSKKIITINIFNELMSLDIQYTVSTKSKYTLASKASTHKNKH